MSLFGGGDDFGDVLGSVLGDLGALVAVIEQAIFDMFVAVLNALAFVWNVLVAVFNFIYRGILAVVRHLRAVADWIHTRLLGKIIEWVHTIKAKLHAIFDPIFQWIRRIQALQKWYYDNVFKPFIDLIQRVRAVLLIFRLLHFKFAIQLDKYLAAQEAKIVRAFLESKVLINQVIAWLNLFMDPFGNIYASVFLNAALTSINALWALLWGAQSRPLTLQEQQSQKKDAAIGTRADTISGVKLRAQTGLTPDDTALQLEAAADFAALGYTF